VIDTTVEIEEETEMVGTVVEATGMEVIVVVEGAEAAEETGMMVGGSSVVLPVIWNLCTHSVLVICHSVL